jgi:hypothetical protein
VKYRKKPVVVEAKMLDTDDASHTAICGWIFGHAWTDRTQPQPACRIYPTGVRIETPVGAMYAMPGDWIIRGIKGEFYPCKPDIFAATYEPVPDDTPSH